MGKQATNAWSLTVMLFLANLVNYYDRAVPAIVVEPIRVQFHLNDLDLGVISAAFTLVYAIAGVPIGRLSDTRSRKVIIAVGLAIWSIFTGLTALAWSFTSILLVRMAVGVGEASYGPAGSSMIGDLFPTNKRSRAMALYWLGLPMGLIFAFFTTGAIIQYFQTWRASFVVAMVPGLVLAVAMLFVREPPRGEGDATRASTLPIDRPFSRILRVRTIWWIIVAGIASNFSAYAANSFLVPLLQRYNGLTLTQAAMSTGLIVGVAGLIGLTAGGWIADALHQRSERGRLLFGAACMAVAAVATGFALTLGAGATVAFVAVFAVGWLFQYAFYVCINPAIHDVIEPRLRGLAFGLYSALLYLLGGAFGPVVVGRLSDHYANAAMLAEGATQVSNHARALGLHSALYLVPVALLLTAVALVFAAGTFQADAEAMRRRLAAEAVGV